MKNLSLLILDDHQKSSQPVTEEEMVTEFLRFLEKDKPNVVLLGVALLLQMTHLTKPW